jgi:hypothetical protein
MERGQYLLARDVWPEAVRKLWLELLSGSFKRFTRTNPPSLRRTYLMSQFYVSTEYDARRCHESRNDRAPITNYRRDGGWFA